MSKRAANTGWICPQCGRRFARIKQSHVCETWSVADLLRDVPPDSISMYQRFVALVAACGTFDFSVTRANIGLRGTRRIFAGVLPHAKGLHGFLDLMHPVEDGRFHYVSPYTQRLFVHHFRITVETELDEAFAEWVREAYAVGQGAHLQ